MKKIILLFVFMAVSVSFYAQNANEFYIKGISKFDQKRYTEAIEYFSKSILQNPDFEDVYLKRGACFVIMEDNKKAIEDFTKVLSLDPNNAIARYNRGLAYKNINQLNMAIVDFSKALETDPYNRYAVYNRALVKLKLDDFKGACIDLARASDLGIENATEILKYTCK